MAEMEKKTRRALGVHLTSTDIFVKYIIPEIIDKINNYIWVDLYAGEGNLILPILNHIPEKERTIFFKEHLFLGDIQPHMVLKCIENARFYGIPPNIVEKNIFQRDNLDNFPEFLKHKNFPIFHITNPPYLYLGYIRKHEETQKYLKYFEKKNEGYQDLYQIAMMNDLMNGVDNLIYIIPSNFLFGASISNKFRLNFLKYYKILKIIIFETKIFEFTGTNICIGFFKRKPFPKTEDIEFMGVKIKKNDEFLDKKYILKPRFRYRAGSEFDEFLKEYRTTKPLNVKYYLLSDDIEKNEGRNEIKVIDANKYQGNDYKRLVLRVNDYLKQKIDSNILFVQTIDKGSMEGRVGLKKIKENLNVQGIYVSGNTYRTHPIQIFINPEISNSKQILLKDYFNFMLENFRTKLDSEFLTTYKYSNADYTRKYLGLTQTRSLIQTFPYNLDSSNIIILKKLIKQNKFEVVLEFLKSLT